MAKLNPEERKEVKRIMKGVVYTITSIHMETEPSLRKRIEEVRSRKHYTDKDIEEVCDRYIDEVTEEYVRLIEEQE